MNRGQGLDHLENTDWTGQGKNYFFGIGINRYEHWDQLSNAVKDVNDFVNVLTTQYQFETDEIHTLFDTDASEGNIYNKIRELKRTLQPQDNLIVYYSGHGHYDEEFEEGYWIPFNAEKDTEDRFISNANIIKRVNAIDTHHTLLIVDSCFSGTLVVKKRSGLTDERFKSRRILASGRQETVADGQPGENSPFAAGILTYLKKNTEKAINTTTLVQYVKNYVETKARQTPVEGRIQNSADEGGEFVFHLKLDEESLWGNVKQKDTAEAYANYLDYYPSGLYANQAEKGILKLKEDDIWRSAKIKDSESAYENYLKKYYSGGKYTDEAKQRLDKLHARQVERQATLDELAKKDEERDSIQKKYDTLVAEAERLFADKQLPKAREKYRDALRYFMSSFVPKTDYIEEQINFCSNGITFLNHYENGRRAMDNYNYRLALQYFGEALKVDDNPKVEDLIRYCRIKLEQTKRPSRKEEVTKTIDIQKTYEPQALYQETKTETTPQRRNQETRQQPPVKKKSSSKVPLIFGGVFIGLVILALVINSIDYEEPYSYPEEAQNIYDGGDQIEQVEETNLENNGNVGQSKSVNPPPTANYANLILGSWQLDKYYSEDEIAAPFIEMMQGMEATYTFYDNGQMNIFSSFANNNFYYYLNDNAISIPNAVPNGRIDRLNRNRLVLTAFLNENGYQFSITYEFRKMD